MLGFYFSPMGRISRKQYWLSYILVYFGVSIAAALLDYFVFPGVFVTADTGPASAIATVVTLWPQVALTSKRFHDRGMSGWWQVPFNIAVAAGSYFAYSALLEINAAMANDIDAAIDPSVVPPLLVGCALVIVAGLAELVILGFLPGKTGANKYGDDPLNPTGKVAEVFA
jgi:uncharacterized membrane protein YhaH (DUF805 family)